MNTLIKTAAVAAFGWLCYKVGDVKGSIVTSGFAFDEFDAELREALTEKGRPFRINAIAAKVARQHIIENLYEEADDEAEEEAD